MDKKRQYIKNEKEYEAGGIKQYQIIDHYGYVIKTVERYYLLLLFLKIQFIFIAH